MIDDPNKPAWAGNFFTGMPAPAGAITVLLPIYLSFLGAQGGLVATWMVFVYTLGIAFLMVSRIPVFSGKKIGQRVPPEMVLPVFVATVIFLALLISYPWELLTAGTLLYLASLPFGWLSYREYERQAASEGMAAAKPAAPGASAASDTQPASGERQEFTDQDRPSRLN